MLVNPGNASIGLWAYNTSLCQKFLVKIVIIFCKPKYLIFVNFFITKCSFPKQLFDRFVCRRITFYLDELSGTYTNLFSLTLIMQ